MQQTLTPVAQASIINYKGAIFYSSPFNRDNRKNLTIFETSDGLDLSRSLNLGPGPASYTSLACGLPGDCAVLYSRWETMLNKFRSQNVKIDDEAIVAVAEAPNGSRCFLILTS